MELTRLMINMRLHQTHNPQENQNQRNFAKFLLEIGNGKYPINPGIENTITLPSDIIIPEGNLIDLIDFIYLNLIQNFGNVNYMVGRAILASKNVDVKKISDIVIDQLPGDVCIYTSADLVDLTEGQSQIYLPEFLRSLKITGLPPGKLNLKVGMPIILLRNLNLSESLCNGIRLICRSLQTKVIDAKIITGSHIRK